MTLRQPASTALADVIFAAVQCDLALPNGIFQSVYRRHEVFKALGHDAGRMARLLWCLPRLQPYLWSRSSGWQRMATTWILDHQRELSELPAAELAALMSAWPRARIIVQPVWPTFITASLPHLQHAGRPNSGRSAPLFDTVFWLAEMLEGMALTRATLPREWCMPWSQALDNVWPVHAVLSRRRGGGRTALGGTALGGTALGETALGGTALGGTALGGTALGETALGGTALGETVDTGSVRGGWGRAATWSAQPSVRAGAAAAAAARSTVQQNVQPGAMSLAKMICCADVLWPHVELDMVKLSNALLSLLAGDNAFCMVMMESAVSGTDGTQAARLQQGRSRPGAEQAAMRQAPSRLVASSPPDHAAQTAAAHDGSLAVAALSPAVMSSVAVSSSCPRATARDDKACPGATARDNEASPSVAGAALAAECDALSARLDSLVALSRWAYCESGWMSTIVSREGTVRRWRRTFRQRMQRMADKIMALSVYEFVPLAVALLLMPDMAEDKQQRSAVLLEAARKRLTPPAPVVEARPPVVEAPVVEAPVVETPVVEAPVIEAPVMEALMSEMHTLQAQGYEPPTAADNQQQAMALSDVQHATAGQQATASRNNRNNKLSPAAVAAAAQQVLDYARALLSKLSPSRFASLLERLPRLMAWQDLPRADDFRAEVQLQVINGLAHRNAHDIVTVLEPLPAFFGLVPGMQHGGGGGTRGGGVDDSFVPQVVAGLLPLAHSLSARDKLRAFTALVRLDRPLDPEILSSLCWPAARYLRKLEPAEVAVMQDSLASARLPWACPELLAYARAAMQTYQPYSSPRDVQECLRAVLADAAERMGLLHRIIPAQGMGRVLSVDVDYDQLLTQLRPQGSVEVLPRTPSDYGREEAETLATAQPSADQPQSAGDQDLYSQLFAESLGRLVSWEAVDGDVDDDDWRDDAGEECSMMEAGPTQGAPAGMR